MSDPGYDNFAPQSVARKTLHGAFALGIRQVLVQGTRILGGIFLARLLPLADSWERVLRLKSFEAIAWWAFILFSPVRRGSFDLN